MALRAAPDAADGEEVSDPQDVARREADTDSLEVPASRVELHRVLTLVHAQARAALHLLSTDPTAAHRALRDVSTHTHAALAALQSPPDPRPDAVGGKEVAAPTGVRRGLVGLPGSGVAFRFFTVGVERPLSPQGDALLAEVVSRSVDCVDRHLTGTAVSVSMTWSDEDLIVLVVVGAERLDGEGGQTSVAPEPDWRLEAVAAAALGGSLRVHRQRNGSVLALELPTRPQPAAAQVERFPQ